MDGKQIIVVTGASSGIGAATAACLSGLGHRVFGTSRVGAPGPDGVEMLSLDVRDDASTRSLVEGVLDREGRIDMLVNNAGTMVFGPIEEISLDDARGVFETNFWGVARLVAAVLAPMRARGRGHIVNVGSIAGHVAIPMNGFYAASKHALAGYTEALRHEVMHLGIRVTLVEPGDVRTQLWREGAIAPGSIPDYASLRKNVLERLAKLGRTAATTSDVAGEILRVVTAEDGPGRVAIGAQSKHVARLRAWMPTRMFENGTRRRFALDHLGR